MSRPSLPSISQRVTVHIVRRGPTTSGTGFEFEPKVSAVRCRRSIPGVEKGLNSVLGSGVVAGFRCRLKGPPLVDGALSRLLTPAALAFKLHRARRSRSVGGRGHRYCSSHHEVEVGAPGRLHRLRPSAI